MHPLTAAVRACVNEVVDPCSRAAGLPAGLLDMGLVRSLDVEHGDDGARVRVVIGVTEYACLLGPAFATEVDRLLRALPGVAEVDVRLDDRFDWVPEDMSPTYQAALSARRQQGGAYFLPLRELVVSGRAPRAARTAHPTSTPEDGEQP